MTDDHATLLAITQGSIDLEQLPSASPAVAALLDAYAAGHASDEDLRAAEADLLAGRPVDDSRLGAPRAPRGT